MEQNKYYIGKSNSEYFVLLSTRPTYWLSGYFAAYQEEYYKYSKFNVREVHISSREGFIKEHPDYEYKEIRNEVFDRLRILYSRLFDLTKGIIEVQENTSQEDSKTLYIINDFKLELIKLLPAGKCEYIEFLKQADNTFNIGITQTSYISIEEYKPISNFTYDLIKYTLETFLSDNIKLLESIFNCIEASC